MKMDQSAEFETSVEGMEWEDILSTLHAMIGEMSRGTANCPASSLPPPSPSLPAGPGVDTHPQPVNGLSDGYGGCIPLGAALHIFEQPSPLIATLGVNVGQAAPSIFQGPLCDESVTQSGHLFPQAGSYSQGQYNNVPMVRLPEGTDQSLSPAGVLAVVYGVSADVFAPPDSAARPPNFATSNFSSRGKRKLRGQQDDKRPYVKKPPNAFMLFMKEQRPIVVAEVNINESAGINVILGQRWNSLSEEERAKYYEEADKERQLHSQRHPDWSSSENYGKRRKRKRSTTPISVQASAFIPEEVTQQAKRPRVPPTAQTVPIWPPHAQTAVTLPVCDICHLPQVYQGNWLNSPTTASTALVSPAAPTEAQTAGVQPLMVEQLEPISRPPFP